MKVLIIEKEQVAAATQLPTKVLLTAENQSDKLTLGYLYAEIRENSDANQVILKILRAPAVAVPVMIP